MKHKLQKKMQLSFAKRMAERYRQMKPHNQHLITFGWPEESPQRSGSVSRNKFNISSKRITSKIPFQSMSTTSAQR